MITIERKVTDPYTRSNLVFLPARKLAPIPSGVPRKKRTVLIANLNGSGERRSCSWKEGRREGRKAVSTFEAAVRRRRGTV